MPSVLSNWKFREVEQFLQEKAFVLLRTNGSHYYYKSITVGEVRNVFVPFHGQRPLKPSTLKVIIEQSSIARKYWKHKRYHFQPLPCLNPSFSCNVSFMRFNTSNKSTTVSSHFRDAFIRVKQC